VVTIVVVGEGVEVVGDGTRWSEVGQGVIVVVVGEGSGVGWLSEVREVGRGRVIIVVRGWWVRAWGGDVGGGRWWGGHDWG
jgi:hypothetical protein